MATTLQQANAERLATKADIDLLEIKLTGQIAETKFDLLKWIVPLLAAQLLALIGLYFR